MTRAFYRSKRVYLGRNGCVWGVLGATWGDLEASWGRLGASVGSLGTSIGRLGASLVRRGASLGRRGGAWSHFAKYTVKLQWKLIFCIFEVYVHRLKIVTNHLKQGSGNQREVPGARRGVAR